MSSLSLSGRLLVLTGRFSIYRTADTICPEFIQILEQDEIQHWRLGKIKFLSGDDKSSWFFMLRQKRKLLYVPDVKAHGFEALPAGSSFVSGTSMLMFRWFGNMIRTNERAVWLGPRVATPFLWWCLVDQRLSAWTALIGPMAAIILALIWGPIHLVHYLVWVAATRSGMALAFGMLWGRCRFTWPGLMLWNQIVGALLKGWIIHHPDRQSWTRQGIHSKASATAAMRLLGALFYVTSFVGLVSITAMILGYASPLVEH
jgi:glycosyltransferase Alg8